MKRVALTALLVDDPEAIKAYERYHAEPWPEVNRDNERFGARRIYIYRYERRLFMFIEADDDFDIDEFGRKLSESGDVRTLEWLKIMDGFMVPPSDSAEGLLWTVLPEIYAFERE